MYIVTIQNGTTINEIHNENIKLSSGQIVKGINTIDSFSFSALPNNPAFNRLKDFQTLVKVYNATKQKYEFYGRVLCSTMSMNDNGLLTQNATCESYFGFLCDSVQNYVAEQNWTVKGLFTRIISTHNDLVEEYKQFKIGEITVTDPNDNVYIGIQRENTWDTISKKLIEKLGGEIRFRVEDDGIYIDYLKKIGEEKETEIALSRNMKSITKDKDPSSFITRLIPLGAKAENSENRLTIASVNNGLNYIDDTEAIKEYGIHTGYVEFDDITTASGLLTAGRNWLTENNKVLIKYSIAALDLSLIGLEIDDFEVYNSHPIKNALLGINDVARISKQTIDICNETKKSFEIGDNFKTLSELRREQNASILGKVNADIAVIVRDYATNKKLEDKIEQTVSTIHQQEEQILLKVAGGYVSGETFSQYKETTAAELDLKVGKDENNQIVSMLNASADKINIKGNRLSIQSDNFELSEDGTIKATNAEISGKINASTGTICDWTIGQVTIPLENYNEAGNTLSWDNTKQSFVCNTNAVEYALASPTVQYGDTSQAYLFLKTYLTARGVYFAKWEYQYNPIASNGNSQPVGYRRYTVVRRSWAQIAENTDYTYGW